ncbi:hypothetical protein [Halorussus marinus]|uniref:hypothetical protein n=1 Tax=Halorussus marinus TaxID=2505976 RepID=UPI00106DD4CD|nr:hypothetical protein [Halorussus marinus]
MKYLYTTPLFEAATTDESDSLGQQLAELGLLDGDSAAVESLSSEAADLTLEGQFRWGDEISPMLAGELEELADAGLSQLPLYQRGDGRYGNRGWYEAASADVEPLHANRRDVWSYTLNLTFVGTKANYFRAVKTNAWQTNHPWGNSVDALIGIPSSARKVRWVDRKSETVAPASAVETISGEPGDVALFDVMDGEAAIDAEKPTLIYETTYPDDVRVGVRLYDTTGNAAKFANNGDGPRQWQIVHSTGHDIEAPVVLSNGVLRVTLDEFSSPNITAERWDDSAGTWSSVDAVETAGADTDWELYDIDITDLGMSDIRAQLEFEHPDQGLYDLNASLQTGRESVLFFIPENESESVPSGLQGWLDPIAAEWFLDPSQERTLVRRKEVRR